MNFLYDSDGKKLRQLTKNGVTDSLREDYIDNKIYENGVLTKVLIPGGYLQISSDTIVSPSYYYFAKDHLGNIRQVLNSNGETLEKNDYYPFGLRHNRADYAILLNNKYKYNGKKQNEFGALITLDYGTRFYDPQLGRWTTIDPLCEDGGQESVTPYGYVFNDPIKHNDPDGRFPLLSNLVGAVAGALVEYVGQVAANVYETKSICLSSFTDNIDVGDIGLAAGEGFLTSGGSIVKNALVKTTVVVGSEIARNYLDVKTSSDGSGLKVSTNDAGTTVKNTAIGLTVGKIGDVAPVPKVKVMNAPTPKQAVSKARVDAKANGTTVNRQQRIATESKAKQGQKTAASINKTVAKTPQSTVASGTSEAIKQQTDEKR